MKDAFGGAFMIKVFLVFIFVYISFTALAINYARAFKVKNKVIEYIEENEITNFTDMPLPEALAMEKYFEESIINPLGYEGKGISCEGAVNYDYCTTSGIKIVKKGDSGNLGVYYEVTTSFGWNLNFLNMFLKNNNQEGQSTIGRWYITGETRVIVKE